MRTVGATPTPQAEITNFTPLDQGQIGKLIKDSPSKSCDLDPLPTWLLKLCMPELLSLITAIVNCSLESSTVPPSLKKALVRPLLKKPTLDQEVMKNYRPVSNLSFISKVIEKAAAAQLNSHLNENDRYDQSAYQEFHSILQKLFSSTF